jgi:hypothetical protein
MIHAARTAAMAAICAIVAVWAACAAPAPPSSIYVPFPDRPASFQWGGIIHSGVIDARGTFRVREKTPVDKLPRQQINGPPGLPVLIFSKPAKVYEFRSGRLVLGVMMPDGEFIPEVGSIVIRIDDYHEGKDPMIWNVPGFFISRDKFEERRKWLAEHLGEDPSYAREKALLDAASKPNR